MAVGEGWIASVPFTRIFWGFTWPLGKDTLLSYSWEKGNASLGSLDTGISTVGEGYVVPLDTGKQYCYVKVDIQYRWEKRAGGCIFLLVGTWYTASQVLLYGGTIGT